MAKVTPLSVVKPIGKTAGVGAVVNSLAVITELLDYLKVKADEETKREQIRAQRDVYVLALETEKELLLKFFEHRFAERATVLEQFFQLMKSAVDSKTEKALDVALTGIVSIMQDNPLRDLSEFRRNMADPAFQIEL
jgi:hypothetical protein